MVIPLEQFEEEKAAGEVFVLLVLTFAVVGVIVYYAIGGFESSIDKVNADEKHQAGSAANGKPQRSVQI